MSGAFTTMGLDRITSDLRLPVEPALATRVRELLLRPAEDPVDAAEAIAVATELQVLADVAHGHVDMADADVLTMRRAAAVLRLRAGDDDEGVRLLLEVHAGLAATAGGHGSPTPEEVGTALWCLSVVAIAHHEGGRRAAAAAASATAREEAQRAHADGLIGAEELVDLETILAFGAADPTRSRGSIRALERAAIGMLGPAHGSVFLIRDLHGELLTELGEFRRATRHYAAMVDDLTRELGPRDQLTVRARSSHAFALAREGGTERQLRALRLYGDLAADVEAVVTEGTGGIPVDLVAVVRRNWLEFLVNAGRADEADAVYAVAIEAARAAAADGGDVVLQRVAGGAVLGPEAGIASLLNLRARSLTERGRTEDAVGVLAELHGILEGAAPMPYASATEVLFRLVRGLHALDRDTEAAHVLHDALDARSDRHGWGSEPHVAAFAIAAYSGMRRAGPEAGASMAVMALQVMDEARVPAAERHRPVLERLRDGLPVEAVDLVLDG